MIILPSTSSSPKRLLSMSYNKIMYAFISSTSCTYITHPNPLFLKKKKILILVPKHHIP
jgi:hypothetical protein